MSRSSTALFTLATVFATLFSSYAHAYEVCSDIFKSEYDGLLNPASSVFMVTELKAILPPGVHEALVDGQLQTVLVRYHAGTRPGETPPRTGGVEIILNDRPLISTDQVPLTTIEGNTPAQDTQYGLNSMVQNLPGNRLLISTQIRNGNRAHRSGFVRQANAIELELFSTIPAGQARTIKGRLYSNVRTEYGTRRGVTEASTQAEIKIMVRAKN